ncbi:MAG: DNA polymerase Y family protein [Spongiibacteraceae bacterium]|nr:DNA polymerase Y family protein [Spongiibacteraceae bacterium]
MVFLCLRFPYLPLEVFNERYRGADARVVEESRRVFLASEQAEKKGIEVGMSLATARALMDGGVYSRNLAREQQCLQRLLQIAYRFTPLLACYRDDALLLDIGASLRLFGGISSLLQTLKKAFEKYPYDYCYGVAHTAKAAWLLSYCEPRGQEEKLTLERVRQQLSTIPVSLLADFSQVTQRLQQSGIKHLGQVLAIPMAELKKRFGCQFGMYIQEISGERTQRLAAFTLPPVFSRSVDCSYAVSDWQLLLVPIKNLLMDFVDYLKKHQLQCSELVWSLWSPDHQSFEFTVSCQRVFSQCSVLLELTQIKLSTLCLERAVETVELRCEKLTRVQLLTPSLFEEDKPSQDSFHLLVSRLRSRFNDRQVYQLRQKNSHIPEQAYEAVSMTEPACKGGLAVLANDRPCWLFAPPLPLRYQHGNVYWHGLLTLLQGPERIESNWWQQALSRDYFIALHQDKQRCWIFRDRLQQQWYLHGLFA